MPTLTISGTDLLLDGIQVAPFGLRAANALISTAKVTELIDNLDLFRSAGIQSINVSLQGAGTGNIQGFESNGALKDFHRNEMVRLLTATEKRKMVLVVTYFYFGTDQDLDDEQAVLYAIDEATVFLKPWRHIWVYAANEHGHGNYDHDILVTVGRRQEIVDRIKALDSSRLVSVGGLPGTADSIGDINANTRATAASGDDGSGRPDVVVENTRTETSKGVYSGAEKNTNRDRATDSRSNSGYWFWHSGWVQDAVPTAADVHFIRGGQGTEGDEGDGWLYDHMTKLVTLQEVANWQLG